jgi:hypothetical protein
MYLSKPHVYFCLFVLPVMVILWACNSIDKQQEKKEIHSVFTLQVYQPGWDAKEWKWEGNVIVDGEAEGSENKFIVFSRWNNDSLYFYFKVMDNCLRAYQTEQDHERLFLDDMVEVLIDTQNTKDSCWGEHDIVYHINLMGVKKDDRGTPECITDPEWNGNARISVQLFGSLNDTTDIDTGYIVTLVLPWQELEQVPQPGLIMGINFANGDNDGKGRQLFDWVGAWPMRSPYAFGDLIIIN